MTWISHPRIGYTREPQGSHFCGSNKSLSTEGHGQGVSLAPSQSPPPQWETEPRAPPGRWVQTRRSEATPGGSFL